MFRVLDKVTKFMHPRRPSLWLNPAVARTLETIIRRAQESLWTAMQGLFILDVTRIQAPTTRHSEERSNEESKKPRDQDDNADK